MSSKSIFYSQFKINDFTLMEFKLLFVHPWRLFCVCVFFSNKFCVEFLKKYLGPGTGFNIKILSHIFGVNTISVTYAQFWKSSDGDKKQGLYAKKMRFFPLRRSFKLIVASEICIQHFDYLNNVFCTYTIIHVTLFDMTAIISNTCTCSLIDVFPTYKCQVAQHNYIFINLEMI